MASVVIVEDRNVPAACTEALGTVAWSFRTS